MTMRRTMPVLAVRDVVEAAEFYQRLGFKSSGFWGDPPGFCILERGTVTIALDRHDPPGALPINQQFAAYVYVDDADALYAEYAALDGVTLGDLDDRYYGCRDFSVTDPDGQILVFGHDLDVIDRNRAGLSDKGEARSDV